jgi:hypothetical protein
MIVRNRIFSLGVVLLIMVQLCASISFAQSRRGSYTYTWVRGKIERRGQPNYPASKLRVTLVPQAYKNDQSRAVVTYTGDDGMYDFKVRAGSYVLRIWTSEKESSSYLIVVRAQQYLDIAPIVIP